MKPITLRNLPPEIARAVRKRTDKEKTSLNKTVIGLLEESLGGKPKQAPAIHHELDALAGVWTKRDAATFERALADQRRIDPELWK